MARVDFENATIFLPMRYLSQIPFPQVFFLGKNDGVVGKGPTHNLFSFVSITKAWIMP